MDAKQIKSPEIFKNRKEIFQVIGNWADQTKESKTKFYQPKDVDSNYEIGQGNDMVNHIGTSLEESRKEVINIIKMSHFG